ncbi:MAG: response regulator [Gammaproteobacteria bacterium]|nr:response regulator [Gammaproteobacteria bacterium]
MNQSNILIIDDNKDLADGLAMVLEIENYHVTVAYNGGDGIKKFDAGNYDLVVIDVKLPDMYGIEVYQDIHQKDVDMKVMMMTGFRIDQVFTEIVGEDGLAILRSPENHMQVYEAVTKIKDAGIVVVVDEQPNLATSIYDYLTAQGTKTILSKDDKEAVARVLSDNVEVLVLDFNKPIMCGLETYMQLKKQGREVKTIIVAEYKKEEVETTDILRSLSITGCLFKPFKPDDMIKMIKYVMSS